MRISGSASLHLIIHQQEEHTPTCSHTHHYYSTTSLKLDNGQQKQFIDQILWLIIKTKQAK